MPSAHWFDSRSPCKWPRESWAEGESCRGGVELEPRGSYPEGKASLSRRGVRPRVSVAEGECGRNSLSNEYYPAGWVSRTKEWGLRVVKGEAGTLASRAVGFDCRAKDFWEISLAIGT